MNYWSRRMAAIRCLAALWAASCVLRAAPAMGQPAGKVHRLGFLAAGSGLGAEGLRLTGAFREALRELGWFEGKNIAIEYRFADGHMDRLPDLAAELVNLNVDVIVALPTAAAVAAKRATGTIPIVMTSVGDPVGLGLVASFARPGGNVTGVSYTAGALMLDKQLELLQEAVPRVARIAVLLNPDSPVYPSAIADLRTAARSLALVLQVLEVRHPNELPAAFAAMARERAQALLVVQDTVFMLHRTQIAELAVHQRLPSMYGLSASVESGGLMSYGPDLSYQLRQAAVYVHRILKGTRPADLPIEQPTQFELAINLKTANALCMTIPQSVLLRATRVIE